MALEGGGAGGGGAEANGTDAAKQQTPSAEARPAKQMDPSTAFLRAARAGQLQAVRDLLDTAAVKDINTCNSNGLNALHLAAKDGHVEVVQELLNRGAVVDAATKKGNTALHIAALAGQEAAAKALLAAGAAPDAQSAAGFTPLYMAAQEGHASCVRLLLARGASQSLATEDGFTPLAVAMQQGHDRVVAELLESDTRGKVRLPALHIAAKKDDVKAATLLLENDHNPDACSKSGFTPLHIAAHYGNTAVATVLRQRGADVNHAAKHSITPLHVASKWGQAPMVDLLIEHGANIGAVTRDGLTPLHCAARSGHTAVVSRLLQQGAPIACKTKNGLTPLHMSVQGEHVEVARALLAAGAPIDDVTVDYLTALHVAAHCGHVKVAKLLLDRNADANARALNGFTPLHIACKKNRLRVVELLLKYGANISATTESGLTPLHVAAFMGCLNVAIHLVQQGAPADRATARGETPLHLAARAQQTDLIRVLLRNGAQVDARAREEQTALHVAARLGHADIASLLLQHGAVVEARTKDAYTPLHIASKEGKEEVASILLEHGASVSSQTRKGFTPLHLAAKYGRGGTARLLVKQGAEVDACGKNSITPLHMATYYGHPDIALLLLDKGASPHSLAKNGHSALHVACRHNHPDIAFALLEHGADPCVKSRAGFTALHMAAQEGHGDCIEMLLDRQANVNDQANNGLTPLHLAAQEGRAGAAGTLLTSGANIDARTHDGYTPLHVASHFGQHAVVRLLLDHNADVHSTTSIGYTPLHQAAQQGHTLVIHMLLKSKADPNALTNSGQTACGVADRLGYIGVVEALRPVTEHTVSQAAGDSGTGPEGRYRVAAPELMQDTFMSDSEDEGGEVECLAQQQQQYRYMREAERGKEMTDSSLPILASANNVHVDREPLHIGFLASFVIDARGGAMRSARRAGLAVIAPPGAVAQPTRITCRHARRAPPHPPPLMEGEALAARLLHLAPPQATFLSPIILEVPTFTSECRERELVILRSDTGETWQDHYLHNADNQMIQDALAKDKLEGEAGGDKIIRIVTCDFPQYFAVVSRVRQEMHIIGPEGGTISSSAIPQVQALFPPAALTKRIRVGLQAQAPAEGPLRRILGRASSASPVLTVEPRRRKFHRGITLTMPLPPTAQQNQSGTGSSLRLLCSIMGGQASAVWEDVTGSTPLTYTDDCVSFTTTVSARFWLMDCRNISDATKLATELYKEMLLVPFEARFIILGKRVDALEGRLLILCLTDQQLGKTLMEQEHYTELAQSSPIILLDSKNLYLEFSGNLTPVTKAGHQINFKFDAFKDNRCEFSVRMKDPEDLAAGRVYFMTEPKASRGEVGGTASCALDIQLPRTVAPRAAKSNLDCLNLDQSGFDALKDELSNHWGDSLGRNTHFTLPRHIENDFEDDDKHQVNGKVMSNGMKPTKDQINKEVKANGQISVIQNGVDSDNDNKTSKPSKQTLEIFDSDDDRTISGSVDKSKHKIVTKVKDEEYDITSDVKIKDEKQSDPKSSSPDIKLQPEGKIEESAGQKENKIIDVNLLDKIEDMFENLSPSKVVHKKEKVVENLSKPAADSDKEIEEVFYKVEKKSKNKLDNKLDSEDLISKIADDIDLSTNSNKVIDLCDDIKIKKMEADIDVKYDLPEKIEKYREQPEKIEDSIICAVKEQDYLNKKFDEIAENISVKSEDINKTFDELTKDLYEKEHDLIDKSFNVETSLNLDDKSKEFDNLVQRIDVGVNEGEEFLNRKMNEDFNYLLQGIDKESDNFKYDINQQILQAERQADSPRKIVNDGIESSVRGYDDLMTSLKDDFDSKQSNVSDAVGNFKGELQYLEGDLLQSKIGEFENFEKDSRDYLSQLKDSFTDKEQSLSDKFDDEIATTKAMSDTAVGQCEKRLDDLYHEGESLSKNVDESLIKLSDQMSDIGSSVEKQYENTIDDLSQKEQSLRSELSSKTDEIMDEGQSIRSNIESKIEDYKDSAEDKIKGVQSDFKKVSDDLEEKKEQLFEKTSQNITDLSEDIKDKTDSLDKDINQTLSSVSDSLNDVMDSMDSQVSDFTDSVNEKGKSLKSQAEQKGGELKDSVSEQMDSTGKKLNEKKEELLEGLEGTQKQAKEAGSKAMDLAFSKIPGIKKSKGKKK